MRGNTLSSNEEGGIFLLDESGNNIITNNSFFNDGLWVSYSYHNNVENNTVNGKPLVYLEETSDKVIDEAGQVILIGCENITIQNHEISNICVGIKLLDTYNCLISGNTLSPTTTPSSVTPSQTTFMA